MFGNKKELLYPPHESLLGPYQSLYDIPAFTNKFFKCQYDPKFSYQVLAELRSTHAQSYTGKVPVVPLLTRTLLMAAEYGYPDVSQRKGDHESKYNKQMTDPLHLIELAIYLAKRNVKTFEKKEEYLEKYPDLTDEEIMQIWQTYVRQTREQDTMFDIHPLTGKINGLHLRWDLNLPLLYPDNQLHRKIAEFDLTGADAERMTKEDFKKAYFPQIITPFSQFCNLEEILQ